ncbi:MAG TPA: DUF5777 family beta-barrel protein [Vicinamibacterales bacterium]
MIRHSRSAFFPTVLAVAALLLAASSARAQSDEDDDAKLRPAEPDFTLINLPTTLPLPRHASDFHLTHRFGLDLTSVDFGDAAANLFGLDNGASIGLEYRFGIIKHVEAIVLRTSLSKTFQFTGKYDGWHQGDKLPVGISAIVSVEGENNFQENYSGSFGVVVSRVMAQDRLALYANPMYVTNTGTGGVENENTGFLGLGARVRVLESTYGVVEVTPRIGGYVIQDAEYAFSIEKRVGAHVFSLVFQNGGGTTFRQLSHGGPGGLYMGFNLTRKFF